jgi:hypothetical protein
VSSVILDQTCLHLTLHRRRRHLFRGVGQFVAKAMLDSRIIDMSFNKIFLKLVLGEQVPVSSDTLKLVDPDLAASLRKLPDIASSRTSEDGPGPAVSVENLVLDFTLPGHDIELRVSLLSFLWAFQVIDLLRCRLLAPKFLSRLKTCRSVSRRSSMPYLARAHRNNFRRSGRAFRKSSL